MNKKSKNTLCWRCYTFNASNHYLLDSDRDKYRICQKCKDYLYGKTTIDPKFLNLTK